MNDSFSLRGMLLGASSAATQVEGGDRNNSWFDWYQRGHIKDGSDPSVATMHWERWREDAELMHELGLGCCRLGLEWSRLEPERGVFDDGAFAHYREELQYLNSLGIKPMVTLWHFTNPLWFEYNGGFLAPDAVKVFVEFVERVVSELGDLADCWITLNEPNVYAVNGYTDGSWPPGRRSLKLTFDVLNAMVPCHIEAYKAIQRKYPHAMVSFALHARVFDPADPRNPIHAAGARVSEYVFQSAMTKAMLTGEGAFPFDAYCTGKYYDFVAINYYSRSSCSGIGDGVRPNCPKNDLGWEIYPEGIARIVRRLTVDYPAPVYITENGTCDNTDSFRCRYLYDHLKALAECGVTVERYYHWCFCDNFEWLEGGSARFGLVHTDYGTQERQVKRSGRFYAEIIKNGGVTQEMYDEYVASQEYNIR